MWAIMCAAYLWCRANLSYGEWDTQGWANQTKPRINRIHRSLYLLSVHSTETNRLWFWVRMRLLCVRGVCVCAHACACVCVHACVYACCVRLCVMCCAPATAERTWCMWILTRCPYVHTLCCLPSGMPLLLLLAGSGCWDWWCKITT